MNATQGIETRPREWFAQDKLITDFRITDVRPPNSPAARQKYAAITYFAGVFYKQPDPGLFDPHKDR